MPDPDPVLSARVRAGHQSAIKRVRRAVDRAATAKAAADSLGVSRATLFRWLDHLGIQPGWTTRGPGKKST